jgi:T5SS/PEP-CTERM-associated repeat protein
MNTSLFPRKLTSKLTMLLMALPVTGAFAAYDYNTTLSAYNTGTSTATFSANNVLDTTLTAASVTKAGTASDLNTNYIGWSTTPTDGVNLFWTTTGIDDMSGTRADLVVGGAITSSATASSSFNTLTIADYVNVDAGYLIIGEGALVGGSGTDAKSVSTAKLANSNAVAVTGAAYSATQNTLVNSGLSLNGGILIGQYGNSNSLSVTSGATVSSNSDLIIGGSDPYNSTSGSSNSVTVSGSVSTSVVGFSGTVYSTLIASNAYVGYYGSGNTLTVSDRGVLDLSDGALTVGNFGKNNAFTATKAAVEINADLVIGKMPSATGNSVSISDMTLSDSYSIQTLDVGKYGSSNSLTATKAEIFTGTLNVGLGDDNATKDNTDDGTEGFIASEGNSNTATITSSTIQMDGALTVGYYGSSNTATISGTAIYKNWTDLPHGTAEEDGVVQLDEIITGISALNVGLGYYASSTTTDYTAFGCNNSLTIDSSSVFNVGGNIMVGDQGSGNKLVIKGGTNGFASSFLVIGYGNEDRCGTAYGSNNAVTLSGTGTALELGDGLSFGAYGSGNALTISGGAKLTVDGNINEFGNGAESNATLNNAAYGSSNVMTVTGKGSTLTVDSTSTTTIGYFGSNNQLIVADGATVSIGDDVVLGRYGEDFGTVLNVNRVYSQGNKISVSGGSTLNLDEDLIVGGWGIKNSVDITGDNTSVNVNDSITIGMGGDGNIAFGSNNSLTLSDNAALIVPMVSIGSPTSAATTNNTATISSGAVLVVTDAILINDYTGEKNYLRLNGGVVALRGKSVSKESIVVTWEDYILNGFELDLTEPSYSFMNGTSLVDLGAIQVWDASTSSYVKAKKSDLSLKYYSSEAEAVAATGYAGLAGYTVLTQANDLSRLAWAGKVYDAGNGSYCSSWYGWFYNDAAYGDYIMSYNDYAWQYVSPDSTPDSTYLYDTKLGAWLFTNQTYFANKWVYNYATSAWQKLGE